MIHDPNTLSISQRLTEYFRRLSDAPPASSAAEALTLVCDLLDQVEDELSGILKQDPPPSPGMSDGRIYPPLADYIKLHPDGSLTARSRSHNIEIGADGTITIVNRRSKYLEIFKAGAGI